MQEGRDAADEVGGQLLEEARSQEVGGQLLEEARSQAFFRRDIDLAVALVLKYLYNSTSTQYST